ncbi:surface glycoprotein [Natronoglomus mannanivorans]
MDEQMNKNQIIALLFATLMVTSMVAWGATFIF